MLDKIESFLFDVLGLFVPGLIFGLLIITLPSLVIEPSQQSSLNPTILFLLSTYKIIADNLNSLKPPVSLCFIAIIAILCYLSGNTIKVLSKYQYDICKLIFDDTLNKLLCFSLNWSYGKISKNMRVRKRYIINHFLRFQSYKNSAALKNFKNYF